MDGIDLTVHGMVLLMESDRPIKPTVFPGVWLRGALGRALWRGSCPWHEAACTACNQRSTCPYLLLFRPDLAPETAHRLPAYWLHDWQMAADGRSLAVVLMVAGSGCAFLALWLEYLRHHTGGFSAESNAGSLHLRQAFDLVSKQVLFTNDILVEPFRTQPLPWILPKGHRLRIELVKPLVSKHAWSSEYRDPLLGALHTRVRRLLRDYGQSLPTELDPPPWQVVGGEFQPQTISTGKSRAGRLQGLRGWMEVENLTDTGRVLLALGSHVHAGGETSLGCGRITVTPIG